MKNGAIYPLVAILGVCTLAALWAMHFHIERLETTLGGLQRMPVIGGIIYRGAGGEDEAPTKGDMMVGWHQFHAGEPVPDSVEIVTGGVCVWASDARVIWYRDSGAWVYTTLTAAEQHAMHCWVSGREEINIEGMPTHWPGLGLSETFKVLQGDSA